MVVCWTSVQVHFSFFNMSILQGSDDKGPSISSDPTLLCFCNKSEWNCKEATQQLSQEASIQVNRLRFLWLLLINQIQQFLH